MAETLRGALMSPQGSQSSIDVGPWIDKIEASLSASMERRELLDALAILERWQADPMIDERSRGRAKALLQQFTPVSLAGLRT